MKIAKRRRDSNFPNVSSGLLSPLGVIFGLLAVFIVSQVWGDTDRAESALDREAGALRMQAGSRKNIYAISEVVFVDQPKAIDIHTAPVLDAEAAVLGGEVL